jgi:hypothetical protein
MNRLPIHLVLLIISIVLSCVQPTHGQLPRYRPTSPTLSPYFDLFRRDTGPLGGYHSDYLPRQEFRRSIQQQGARLQQQNASIRSLDQRMSLAEQPPYSVRPTGTGSVFMNYSHYYQVPGHSGSRAGSRSWSPSSSRSRGFSQYGGYGSYGQL